MTKEEKDLLFNDLCARVPYKIRCSYYDICLLAHCNGEIYGIENKEYAIIDGKCINIGFIKPYLLPMSSMTEEQSMEFALLQVNTHKDGFLYVCDCANMMKWLLKNHFDVYGLIPKGLAEDATNLNIY